MHPHFKITLTFTISIRYLLELIHTCQYNLTLTRILPFGGIGDALLKYVRARILKKLIKLRASEHLRMPIIHD